MVERGHLDVRRLDPASGGIYSDLFYGYAAERSNRMIREYWPEALERYAILIGARDHKTRPADIARCERGERNAGTWREQLSIRVTF
jgi:hypothetical protein